MKHSIIHLIDNPGLFDALEPSSPHFSLDCDTEHNYKSLGWISTYPVYGQFSYSQTSNSFFCFGVSQRDAFLQTSFGS